MKDTKGETRNSYLRSRNCKKGIILLYRWSEKNQDTKQIILHKR